MYAVQFSVKNQPIVMSIGQLTRGMLVDATKKSGDLINLSKKVLKLLNMAKKTDGAICLILAYIAESYF
jgi:hypothetical protein